MRKELYHTIFFYTSLFYVYFWQQALETINSSFGVDNLDQGPDPGKASGALVTELHPDQLCSVSHSKCFNVSLKDSFWFSQPLCPQCLDALKEQQQQQKVINTLVLSLFPAVACSGSARLGLNDPSALRLLTL